MLKCEKVWLSEDICCLRPWDSVQFLWGQCTVHGTVYSSSEDRVQSLGQYTVLGTVYSPWDSVQSMGQCTVTEQTTSAFASFVAVFGRNNCVVTTPFYQEVTGVLPSVITDEPRSQGTEQSGDEISFSLCLSNSVQICAAETDNSFHGAVGTSL